MSDDAAADIAAGSPTEPNAAPAVVVIDADEAEATEPAVDAATDVSDDGETDAAPAVAATAPPLPRHPAMFVVLVALPVFAFAAFGFTEEGIVTAFASAVLVWLAAIDLDQRIIPNRILAPATAALLVLQIAFYPDQALEWVLAGAAAAAFLALPLVLNRDAMGMGDVKLAFFLGVALGWDVFSAIIVGCLALLPVAVWMLVRDGTIRNAKLPFGPFLALGTIFILFAA